MKGRLHKGLFPMAQLGMSVIAVALITAWAFPVLSNHDAKAKLKEKNPPVLSSMTLPVPRSHQSTPKKKKPVAIPKSTDEWVRGDSVEDVIQK